MPYIDREDSRRAVMQQDIGEAPGRGPDIKANPPVGRQAKMGDPVR